MLSASIKSNLALSEDARANAAATENMTATLALDFAETIHKVERLHVLLDMTESRLHGLDIPQKISMKLIIVIFAFALLAFNARNAIFNTCLGKLDVLDLIQTSPSLHTLPMA